MGNVKRWLKKGNVRVAVLKTRWEDGSISTSYAVHAYKYNNQSQQYEEKEFFTEKDIRDLSIICQKVGIDTVGIDEMTQQKQQQPQQPQGQQNPSRQQQTTQNEYDYGPNAPAQNSNQPRQQPVQQSRSPQNQPNRNVNQQDEEVVDSPGEKEIPF